MYAHVQILSFWSRARKSIIFIYWSFQYQHLNIYCIPCLCDFLDELNGKKKVKICISVKYILYWSWLFKENLQKGTYQLCNSDIYQPDINMECKFNKF